MPLHEGVFGPFSAIYRIYIALPFPFPSLATLSTRNNYWNATAVFCLKWKLKYCCLLYLLVGPMLVKQNVCACNDWVHLAKAQMCKCVFSLSLTLHRHHHHSYWWKLLSKWSKSAAQLDRIRCILPVSHCEHVASHVCFNISVNVMHTFLASTHSLSTPGTTHLFTDGKLVLLCPSIYVYECRTFQKPNAWWKRSVRLMPLHKMMRSGVCFKQMHTDNI